MYEKRVPIRSRIVSSSTSMVSWSSCILVSASLYPMIMYSSKSRGPRSPVSNPIARESSVVMPSISFESIVDLTIAILYMSCAVPGLGLVNN